MNITPEMLASLPPHVRQQLRQKMIALLDDLGVPFTVSPVGDLVVDLQLLAPALGMTVAEAQVAAGDEAAKLPGRVSLRPMH